MNLRALRSSFATRPDEDLAIFDKPENSFKKVKKKSKYLKNKSNFRNIFGNPKNERYGKKSEIPGVENYSTRIG